MKWGDFITLCKELRRIKGLYLSLSLSTYIYIVYVITYAQQKIYVTFQIVYAYALCIIHTHPANSSVYWKQKHNSGSQEAYW